MVSQKRFTEPVFTIPGHILAAQLMRLGHNSVSSRILTMTGAG